MEGRLRGRPRFPSVLKTHETATGFVFTLRVPADLYYLEGHFPGRPIVPGVCQLQWVIAQVKSRTERPLHIRAIEDVKFHRPLPPLETFMMELIRSVDGSEWHFELSNATRRFSSGRLLVQEL